MTQLQGRRPGDRRVRIERVAPQVFALVAPRRLKPPPSPSLVLVAGFTLLIAVGTVLLMLPPMAVAGTWTSPLTAFFTATSAVCVTGLVVVDTATHWTPAGQVVILALIQLGGFGFMTSSTLLLFLLVRRRTGLRDRILVQESIGAPQMGDVMAVVRRVALFTVIAEVAGAIVLAFAFAEAAGLSGPAQALWWGAFHSISAFNNAGFDLTGGFQSLIPFAGAPQILVPLAVLITLGGLGFAIVADTLAKRRWKALAVETRIVLLTSLVLVASGAGLILVLEWGNPSTLGALPAADRILVATFESVSLRTAGFSSRDMASYRDATLFVMMVLIFIGGASGSTAGGIKVTTFSVLLVAIMSAVRGRAWVEAFGRRIPDALVLRAVAVALLSVAFVVLVSLALTLTADVQFIDAAFEAVSAFGTNGMSTGTTRVVQPIGLIITALAMFVGRLGPLTLVIALAARARPAAHRPAIESVRIG